MVKRRILKRPVQNKQTFANRFFELFTLPANLRLNTQRRSAPSMRAFKEEERSVLNERNYRVQNNCVNYWHHVLYVSEGSNHVTATWKKDFFPLFVCLLFNFFLPSAFLFFFLLTFFVIRIFFSIRIFLSAFSHPHPPSAGIRSAFYRHPVKTALIWLILVDVSCFFSQLETICNLHSCYKRTALLSQPIRTEYFFLCILLIDVLEKQPPAKQLITATYDL